MSLISPEDLKKTDHFHTLNLLKIFQTRNRVFIQLPC